MNLMMMVIILGMLTLRTTVLLILLLRNLVITITMILMIVANTMILIALILVMGGYCIMCYSEIAYDHAKKPHKYTINGNFTFSGNGILCSLSNVETMDMLAPRGEEQFNHLTCIITLSFLYTLLFIVDVCALYSFGYV
jgi:hypothetical protein